MSNEENDIELIDRYLSNDLTSDQRAVVDQRLTQDREFGRLLQEMKTAIAAAKVSARERLRGQINDLELEIAKKERATSRSITKYWPLGIAAVLIVGIGIFWVSQKTESKTVPLFAEVFVPYPNVVMPTVRGEDADSSNLKSAYVAYDLGDYQKSISIFSSLTTQDASVLLYLGNCYLATNEPAKARERLELLKANFDVFDEQADWFIALSYLEEKNLKACRNQLQRLVDQQTSYSPKAKDLLSKISLIER